MYFLKLDLNRPTMTSRCHVWNTIQRALQLLTKIELQKTCQRISISFVLFHRLFLTFISKWAFSDEGRKSCYSWFNCFFPSEVLHQSKKLIYFEIDKAQVSSWDTHNRFYYQSLNIDLQIHTSVEVCSNLLFLFQAVIYWITC